MGQDFMTILTGIGTVVLMLAVFVGAYYFSKFISKKYQPKYGSAKNIEIIERMVVGKDQSLALVKVLDKVFLLAFTAQSVTKIEEMDASLFPVNTDIEKMGDIPCARQRKSCWISSARRCASAPRRKCCIKASSKA